MKLGAFLEVVNDPVVILNNRIETICIHGEDGDK